MSFPTLPCTFERTRELVHQGVSEMEKQQYRPDVILAIAGGGLVPGRILRTALGEPTVPIYCVGVQSYLQEGKTKQEDQVYIYQWLESRVMEEWRMNMPKILVVDDINDSGNTLRAVTKRLHLELEQHNMEIGVFVVHDKTTEHYDRNPRKPLTSYIEENYAPYFACEVVPKDYWLDYAWEL